jgi:hypothetical protein
VPDEFIAKPPLGGFCHFGIEKFIQLIKLIFKGPLGVTSKLTFR